MKKQNNRGAILVFVLLISSIMISTGTALWYTSVLNYKMKKLNSRVKRAFYTAEGALNEAYAIAGDFIEAGVEYADTKDCSRTAYLNFLLGKCEDIKDHQSLVDTLKDKNNYLIYKDSNTIIDANLCDKTDYLQLEIKSCCIDDKIEKRLKLICRILIPYNNSSTDSINSEDLICIYDWVSER